MAGNSKMWIGTGWKMNKMLSEAEAFAQTIRDVQAPANIQRFVIPPFTCLREVKSLLADTDVMVGAQNMHWQNDGAWTGEISAPMLVDCQADLVELGHSERRTHFAETDHDIGLKVEAALNHGLIPLICIGETRDQRDAGQASNTLKHQVSGSLERVLHHVARDRIVFAYEPVWAIGDQGEAASAEYANTRQQEIAQLARELLGASVPCLYGGSVNAENCEQLIVCEYIDGLFIGRAAWDALGYLDIIERCARALD
ncbi:MAG: triose-phosphate isomerase [Granulosicoccus sp.]|nr:triose-phosphate isomerase [Granulosicoccus sp.]